jgi:hypothetical protein
MFRSIYYSLQSNECMEISLTLCTLLLKLLYILLPSHLITGYPGYELLSNFVPKAHHVTAS